MLVLDGGKVAYPNKPPLKLQTQMFKYLLTSQIVAGFIVASTYVFAYGGAVHPFVFLLMRSIPFVGRPFGSVCAKQKLISQSAANPAKTDGIKFVSAFSFLKSSFKTSI